MKPQHFGPNLPPPQFPKSRVVALASIIALTVPGVIHWHSVTDFLKHTVTHFSPRNTPSRTDAPPKTQTPAPIHSGKTNILFICSPDGKTPARGIYALIGGEPITNKRVPTSEGALEIPEALWGETIWVFCAISNTRLGQAVVSRTNGQVVIVEPAKPSQDRPAPAPSQKATILRVSHPTQ